MQKPDSVVGVVIRLQTGLSLVRILAGTREFCLLQHPDMLGGPPSLLINGQQGSLQGVNCPGGG